MRIKDGLLSILLTKVAIIALGIVGLRYATLVLDTKEYGVYSLLATFQILVGHVLVAGIGQHLNLNAYTWLCNGSLKSNLRVYYGFVILASFVGGVLSYFWILSNNLNDQVPEVSSFLVSMMILSFTISTGFAFLCAIVCNQSTSNKVTLSSSFLCLIFSIAFTSISRNGTMWFAGQMVGYLISGLIGVGAIYSGINNFSLKQKVNNYDYPRIGFLLNVTISNGLLWVAFSSYRLIIDKIWGLEVLGEIVIGFSIAAQCWGLIESIITQHTLPKFMKLRSNNSIKKAVIFSEILNFSIPIYISVLAGTIGISSFLVNLFISKGFPDATLFFCIGSVLECSRVIHSFIANYYYAVSKQRFVMLYYLILCIFILLSFFSGRIFGFDLAEAMILFASVCVTNAIILLIYTQLYYLKSDIILDYWKYSLLLIAAQIVAIFSISNNSPNLYEFIKPFIVFLLGALLLAIQSKILKKRGNLNGCY